MTGLTRDAGIFGWWGLLLSALSGCARETALTQADIVADSLVSNTGPLDLVGYKLKLDHIYYRHLEFVAAGVSSEAAASDHFPVWSVFHWRD